MHHLLSRLKNICTKNSNLWCSTERRGWKSRKLFRRRVSFMIYRTTDSRWRSVRGLMWNLKRGSQIIWSLLFTVCCTQRCCSCYPSSFQSSKTEKFLCSLWLRPKSYPGTPQNKTSLILKKSRLGVFHASFTDFEKRSMLCFSWWIWYQNQSSSQLEYRVKWKRVFSHIDNSFPFKREVKSFRRGDRNIEPWSFRWLSVMDFELAQVDPPIPRSLIFIDMLRFNIYWNKNKLYQSKRKWTAFPSLSEYECVLCFKLDIICLTGFYHATSSKLSSWSGLVKDALLFYYFFAFWGWGKDWSPPSS